MNGPNLAAEFDRSRPGGSLAPEPTLSEARRYCRRLAGTHYENFTVASWLAPRPLRQHLCNIYAYCRWADDLADETKDPEESLELLHRWRQQLDDCYQGRARHPVFVALADTVTQFEIPQKPFCDLLEAFTRDQAQNRYKTFDELRAYCRCSANPVGRLVLYLAGSHNDECGALSDSICTGLQLANFCQDVARDFERGRIYLPLESQRRFGYPESMFSGRKANDAFRRLMQHEVDRAESFLREGWPLVECVPRAMRTAIDLFVRGGLAILREIRRVDYDVWTRRPTVGRWRKLGLVLASLGSRFPRLRFSVRNTCGPCAEAGVKQRPRNDETSSCGVGRRHAFGCGRGPR